MAGAVDDRVVVLEDGREVGPGEDRAQLERELAGVAAGPELAGTVRVAGGLGEELAPLLLVGSDAVAHGSAAATHFCGGADEETAPREDPPFDIVEVTVTES